MHRRSGPLHDRGDAVAGQMLFQGIAAICLDLVVLENVEAVRVAVRAGWERQTVDVHELRLVPAGDVSAALEVGGEGFQLETENGGLEVVEPGVQTPRDHLALSVPSMITQKADVL